jgi:hypothetical protein
MALHNLNVAAPTMCVQVEAISCGTFVFAYAYWVAFHNGTLPTTALFPAPHAHVAFRLALINVLCVAGAGPAPLRHCTD